MVGQAVHFLHVLLIFYPYPPDQIPPVKLFPILAVIVVLAACTPAAPPGFDAPPGSMAPELNIGGDGRAYLSWLETDGNGHALRYAVFDDSGWSAPRTVVRGVDLLANWADFPSVTALGDGTLAAHWLVLNKATSHAYDIALSFSRDGGNTWLAPITPHDDRTATEHGFVTLVPAARDRLQLVWLDGRNMDGLDMEHAEEHAAMTLRFAEFDGTGVMLENTELDPGTCSCCQTGAAMAGPDLLVVYRDRSAEEIRDVALLRRAAGAWSAPMPVARDGWRIEACPVNGPGIDARDGKVAVAWFSGAADVPQVQVAFMAATGTAMEKPVRVDAGRAIGRADVVLAGADSALVSWLELSGKQAEVRLRRVYRDGRMDMPETLVQVDPSRFSGFPRMARRGDLVLIAWTQGDAKQRQVRAEVRRVPAAG